MDEHYLLIMKAAAFQPPEVDRRTGRPLKSTTPSTVSNSSGVSESPAIYCRGVADGFWQFSGNLNIAKTKRFTTVMQKGITSWAI